MDLLWVVLPALALLACPLMMLFCVFGMRRMGGSASGAAEAPGSTETRAARVAGLEQQLLALQGELAELRAAPATVPAPVDSAPNVVAIRPTTSAG